MNEDLIRELSLAELGLPSKLAKLYFDTNSKLSSKQLAIIESEINKASDCDVCGQFSGFDGEEVCEEHKSYK
jgi:hypothetical protein